MMPTYSKGRRAVALAVCGFALLLGGCAGAPREKEKSARERQDEALRDPFRYKPDWKDSSVTGGDTADLDKDGLKRDLGHVLMP
jgi:hypothetical protein